MIHNVKKVIRKKKHDPGKQLFLTLGEVVWKFMRIDYHSFLKSITVFSAK